MADAPVHSEASNFDNVEVAGTLKVGDTDNNVATITSILTKSEAVDFASIAAGAVGSATVTVTGAEVGDAVALGPPSDLSSDALVVGAFVSAANTVTIRIKNNHATLALDLASATWRVVVFNF